MATKIYYLYRDAANYKQRGEIVFRGDITDAERKKIIEALNDGTYFIPEQVDFPNPRDFFENLDRENDHCWCELGDGWDPVEAFEVGDFVVTDRRTISDIAGEFAAIRKDGWDEWTYAPVFDFHTAI